MVCRRHTDDTSASSGTPTRCDNTLRTASTIASSYASSLSALGRTSSYTSPRRDERCAGRTRSGGPSDATRPTSQPVLSSGRLA
eukprot:5749464-Prymnesium_polylepis.2